MADTLSLGHQISLYFHLFNLTVYLYIENVQASNYGDRNHQEQGDVESQLAEVINHTAERGGNVVIPSFALERSQELLHDIGVVLTRREIPEATVYLDSPLARKLTEVFIKHAAELKDVEVDEEDV